MRVVVTPDIIDDCVSRAYKSGKPITYVRGPRSDRRARQAFGLRASPGSVCAAINAAVKRGSVVAVEMGYSPTSYSSTRVYSHPRVELRPAGATISA